MENKMLSDYEVNVSMYMEMMAIVFAEIYELYIYCPED